MAFWGREDDCEIRWVIDALGAILPPPPPDAESAFALADPGRVERLMSQAGLTPSDGGEAECAFAYRDHPTAMRGMLSAGPFVAADELLGPEPVRRVVSDALERFRTGDGSYRIRNRIRYVVASA
jgi:hypothetical protein